MHRTREVSAIHCQHCAQALAPLRASRRYCASRCRQAAYRDRRCGKAHQRIVRERLARVSPGPPPIADIKTATVKPISYSEAKAIILKYEWLGSMPAVVSHCYGIFFAGHLGGAVVYGPEYGENIKVWDRYGFAGRLIALQRGACVHWAHPHSAPKLIRRSMEQLPDHIKVVTAAVDAAAGEIGTIYQACGFAYVGQMSKGGRVLVHRDKPVSERTAKRKRGTSGHQALRKLGIDARAIARPARYFAFRGSRVEQKLLRAAIANRLQPYPRRP